VIKLKDAIRSCTEPSPRVIAENIDKLFTHDAVLLHPYLNLTRISCGRNMMKGLYTWLRVILDNNKVEFHTIMFNEDQTQAFIELTQEANFRFMGKTLTLKKIPKFRMRFLVTIHMRKESDGKYRIFRQEDNFPTDLARAGITFIPGLALFSNGIKAFNAILYGILGQIVLYKGWFGV
ncbi:hypothetical protein CROQUDRAFT_47220, partial [Cronartium quercuum f. sp. fusiforme G11]